MSANASHPAFDWQQVDHALANLMLAEASENIRKSIREDERRICSENRDNQNVLAIPTQLLEMHVRRTDEWAQRTSDVYCDVWQKQGRMVSPEFLRAVCANGIATLVASRTGAVIGELELEAKNLYPKEWLKAATAEFRREMKRLFARWQRKAEIEAKTREHGQAAEPTQGMIPAGPKPTQAPLDLPSGAGAATWDTIEISFTSDERVQIRNGTQRETHNYEELGFADGRNGKPNLAWITLRELAEQGGVMRHAKADGGWRKVEKRMQMIRKVLRKRFRISADPIPFVSGGGYQACFKIGCSPSFHT